MAIKIPTEIWVKIGKILTVVNLILGIIIAIYTIYDVWKSQKEIVEITNLNASEYGSVNGWYDTGINLKIQKKYKFQVERMITLNHGELPILQVDANGDRNDRYPCPPFHCGELVARLGPEGKTVRIGKDGELKDQKGRLYLAVWDTYVENNIGGFDIKVIIEK